MSGWRDISTAPSDEQSVIICAGGVVGEAYRRLAGDDADGWWWAGTSPGDYYAEKAETWGEVTHWMPLPAPPRSMKGKDHG